MSAEDLRRRLEQLNRGPLPPASNASIHRSGADEPRRVLLEPDTTALNRLIYGREVTVGVGRCYVISHRLSQCWSPQPTIAHRLATAIETAASRVKALDRALGPVVQAGVDRLLFMDTETCGFNGTPVFLIGVMFLAEGDLHVEQLLARNYEEEPAILARFAERCGPRTAMITFNGKSFDWPFLRDRAAVSRIDLDDPAVHGDLLHISRRNYRDLVPDCRLQTLETHICKRRRSDDIPGSEIPRAYHQFVQTGDARELRQIVHHNFLDLVTLADLLIDLLEMR